MSAAHEYVVAGAGGEVQHFHDDRKQYSIFW